MRLDEKLTEMRIKDEVISLQKKRLSILDAVTAQEIMERSNPLFMGISDVEHVLTWVVRNLDNYLAASDQTLVGKMCENIVFNITKQRFRAKRLNNKTFDLMWEEGNIVHVREVKSGKAWGNSSQQESLRSRVKSLKEKYEADGKILDFKLLICYGRGDSKRRDGITELRGQSAWEEITSNPDFYLKVQKLCQTDSKKYNDRYRIKRNSAINRLVEEMSKFCSLNGSLKKELITRCNSGKEYPTI